MTSKLLVHLIVSLLAAGAAWSVASAQDQRKRPNTKPIHVSRLNRSKVIGALSRPLGEVVIIEGIAADENYTRRKADTGEILLRVQTVNGKALKREAILPFHTYEGAEISKPAAGMRFKHIGYETGGFSGIPGAAFAYVPRVATNGYYFTTSFVVLRDDSRPTKHRSRRSIRPSPEDLCSGARLNTCVGRTTRTVLRRRDLIFSEAKEEKL